MAGEKRSYYLWLAAAILGALLVLAAPLQLYISFGGGADKAIAAGKRIEVNLKTGEIKQLKKEEPAPPAKEEAAAPAVPAEPQEEKVLPNPVAGEAEKANTEEMHPAAAEHPPVAEQKAEAVKPAPAPVPVGASSSSSSSSSSTSTSSSGAVVPVAVPEVPKKPRVAIVVVGLGLSRSSSEAAMELPPSVALSFSPYAFDLAQWMEKAGTARERYLDLPLEPMDYPYSDPGPFALLTGLDDTKNKERLEQVLSRITGYKGLVSGPEERFTEHASSFKWLLAALKEKNLFYIYAARSENYKFRQAAGASGCLILGSDRVIDAGLSAESIDAELKALEAQAKESGYAIAMGRPYPVTIQHVTAWLKTLPEKGIDVVPLSSLQTEKQ